MTKKVEKIKKMFNLDEEKIFCFWQGKKAENFVFYF